MKIYLLNLIKMHKIKNILNSKSFFQLFFLLNKKVKKDAKDSKINFFCFKIDFKMKATNTKL